MRYRPISPAVLAAELTDRIDALAGPRLAVAVDGAAGATGTADLADALVDPLRLRGRATLRVSARDFLRPASLRFEHGRTNPDARYTDWLDLGALRREVLEPLKGSGEVLPSLWDAERDRATRAERVPLPEGAVVLLDGELLLGAGLAFDLAVHLWLSPAALRRRVPDAWAVPAYERYEEEVDPGSLADVVVRVDDPRHPALYTP
ncbi:MULTISPECIES: uridine kinase [unclassified Amycolatopsis]|uniref:uridine kinase n=1 Tax=unclassified Amycolatopsis TaxID=2618356 RepID=UPI0028750FCA|nr:MULTISPECIES: uridine kinase [unclassified Amycolatopsis]MDS0140249.1 uridine kinase [Amycolatopsis sp. 505]MDS0149359.1 uridine kinase [Amycolatopsis sp. CM201R]